MNEKQSHFDLVIIGSGSGNSILSPDFKDKKVALIDEGVFGGTCLNVGCIPTKMYVYPADVVSSAEHAAKLGVIYEPPTVEWSKIVERVFGRIDPISAGGLNYRQTHEDNKNVNVYTQNVVCEPGPKDGPYNLKLADGQQITATQVVLAAGSRGEIPEMITNSGMKYFTNDNIMRIASLPKHLVIIGGGYIGCEFAHVFSALGSKVTQVVRGNALVRHLDTEISERFTKAAKTQWEVLTEEKITSIDATNPENPILTLGSGKTLEPDAVLVAIGRTPNGDELNVKTWDVDMDEKGYVTVDQYQRTTAKNVYALGDICAHQQLKHVANQQAKVVAKNLQHNWDDTTKMTVSNMENIPAAIFTNPQIGTVGLTEEQARKTGNPIVVHTQEYASVAYGWAMEDTVGVCKLIADKNTKQLIGAHIMGYQASILLQTIVTAMTFKIPVPELAHNQYWAHPALPEIIENALLSLNFSA